MAFTITTFNFAKRANSTKQPTGLSGTDWPVVLKEKTSYDQPVFRLTSGSQLAFNYLKWGSWYYFVTGISYVRNDLYEVTCDLDVLATYKTEIGETSAFIMYDTASNIEIMDSRLPLKTTAEYASNTVASSLFSNSYVCVILGVVGKNSTAVYVTIPSTVNALLEDIDNWQDDPDKLPYPSFDITDPDWLGEAWEVLIHNLTSAFRQRTSTGSAAECIRSAVLLPVRGTSFNPLPSSTIWLGEYNTGETGQRLQFDAKATETVTINIPWKFTDWRNGSSNTQIMVHLPYCGVISLSADQLKGAPSIECVTTVSITGETLYVLRALDGQSSLAYLGTFHGNCGSPYGVGMSQVSGTNAAIGIIGGAAGIGTAIATGGASGIAIGAASLMGMAKGFEPLTSMAGSIGGAAYTAIPAYVCCCVTHDTNVEPSSVSSTIGTPTMAVKQIGTLSGYVQTSCVSVDVAAEQPIRDRINQLLDGGIFYE